MPLVLTTWTSLGSSGGDLFSTPRSRSTSTFTGPRAALSLDSRAAAAKKSETAATAKESKAAAGGERRRRRAERGLEERGLGE